MNYFVALSLRVRSFTALRQFKSSSFPFRRLSNSRNTSETLTQRCINFLTLSSSIDAEAHIFVVRRSLVPPIGPIVFILQECLVFPSVYNSTYDCVSGAQLRKVDKNCTRRLAQFS